jgi:hypothetical protein
MKITVQVELYLDSNYEKFKFISQIETNLKRNPLEYLPNEIALQIFSYLKRKDICRAAQVFF